MKACASRVCVLGVVLVWVRVLGRGLRSRWCRAPREDMILRLRLQELPVLLPALVDQKFAC